MALLNEAGSKWKSLWCNLPTWWGRPTLAPLTSGRNYQSLGCGKQSIGALSGDRTSRNSFKMDTCTRWSLLYILGWHSSTGCLWKLRIIPQGFRDSGSWWFSWYKPARIGRWGIRDGEATSNQWHIGKPIDKPPAAILPALSIIWSTVVIHLVLNGNDDYKSGKWLQSSHTDMRHWEGLIDSIKEYYRANEWYWLSVIY